MHQNTLEKASLDYLELKSSEVRPYRAAASECFGITMQRSRNFRSKLVILVTEITLPLKVNLVLGSRPEPWEHSVRADMQERCQLSFDVLRRLVIARKHGGGSQVCFVVEQGQDFPQKLANLGIQGSPEGESAIFIVRVINRARLRR